MVRSSMFKTGRCWVGEVGSFCSLRSLSAGDEAERHAGAAPNAPDIGQAVTGKKRLGGAFGEVRAAPCRDAKANQGGRKGIEGCVHRCKQQPPARA